jgi:iron-sulfur cluster repair protein YtfE (RIC family)
MDQLKQHMTRHESILKPMIDPQMINIEVLCQKIIKLQQQREQLQYHCAQLGKYNKTVNEVNDSLLSRVAILEEVLGWNNKLESRIYKMSRRGVKY